MTSRTVLSVRLRSLTDKTVLDVILLELIDYEVTIGGDGGVVPDLLVAVGIIAWFEPAHVGRIGNLQGRPVGISQRIPGAGAAVASLNIVLRQGLDGYFVAQLAVEG